MRWSLWELKYCNCSTLLRPTTFIWVCRVWCPVPVVDHSRQQDAITNAHVVLYAAAAFSTTVFTAESACPSLTSVRLVACYRYLAVFSGFLLFGTARGRISRYTFKLSCCKCAPSACISVFCPTLNLVLLLDLTRCANVNSSCAARTLGFSPVRTFGWIGLLSATSPVAWLGFGMLLLFVGFPLGFFHCVKKGHLCPENPAPSWTVTRASCNKSMRITWLCGGYSVADIQGNGGDGDEGNQHERSNKGRGP